MGFADDILAFVTHASQAAHDAVADSIVAVGREVFEATPVGTPAEHDQHIGRLAASWYAAVNGSPSGIAGGNADPVGQLASVVSGLNAGDVVTVANMADYASYTEFGTHKETPRPFVRPVLARADVIAADAIREAT